MDQFKLIQVIQLTCGQLNLLSGHETAVQFFSSVPSVQSWENEIIEILSSKDEMTTIVVFFALFPPCIRRSATSQGCTKRCGTGIGQSGMAGNLGEIVFSCNLFVSDFVFVSDNCCFFGTRNRPCPPCLQQDH